jgi:exodeoxyribonuclease X
MVYMFIFLDTETTGAGPEDRLCQIAFKAEDGKPIDALFNPGIPISIEAMAIHHITNEMVADKPNFKVSDTHKKLQIMFADPINVLVAHKN